MKKNQKKFWYIKNKLYLCKRKEKETKFINN